MRITIKEKDETSGEVYVGQVRTDGLGMYAIVSHARTGGKDKPLNAILFTEYEDDFHYGVINWKDGTDASRIKEVFPKVVDAELIIKGEK